MRRPLTSCPAASTSDSDTRTLLVMSSSRPRISTAPTVTACAAPANRKDNAAMAAMRWGRRIAGGYRRGGEGRLRDPWRNDATPVAPHAASPAGGGGGKKTYRFESCRLRGSEQDDVSLRALPRLRGRVGWGPPKRQLFPPLRPTDARSRPRCPAARPGA